jgi:hypothetical protein
LSYEWTKENEPWAPAMRGACIEHGLHFSVWDPDPTPESGAEMVARSGASSYVMQIESIRDWSAIGRAFRKAYPTLPAAIVTTLWGLTVDHTRVLVELGFRCITECHTSENPQSTPDRMDFSARQLGWPATQPLIGLSGGKTLSNYPERARYRGWCAWSAEYLWG